MHNFNFGTNHVKIPIFELLTYKLKTHIIPLIPKGGDMVLKRHNQILNIDFSLSSADLKKHVSIYSRKQVRQKRESISAC